MMAVLEIEWSTFSHVKIWVMEATKVKSLLITTIPLVSEALVSTANVFELILSLVSGGSADEKVNVLPFIIQESVVEFPVVQIQVTVSPGHADWLSQVTDAASTIVTVLEIIA